MEARKPDYSVSTPVKKEGKEGGESQTFWTRLGVGFTNKNGSISLRLNANPLYGELVLFPWSAKTDDD